MGVQHCRDAAENTPCKDCNLAGMKPAIICAVKRHRTVSGKRNVAMLIVGVRFNLAQQGDCGWNVVSYRPPEINNADLFQDRLEIKKASRSISHLLALKDIKL